VDRELPDSHLPIEILERASRAGNELAWRVPEIPNVILAARDANLVNIGGQLQFRLPGATCECYWVEVDTYRSVDKALPWSERVALTAEVALRNFRAITSRFDMVAEGRLAFPAQLDALVADGEDPSDFIWFVWYVLNEEEAESKGL
jgi:hypothetical protein